ncbi:MAG TPA: sigma-70 family RNA polymerase sigma factor [Acidobacteriaceae bacterium]|nr:sigma-70 family RNA polymerase sigma factor [Acidobacteriaceae bacterium]
MKELLGRGRILRADLEDAIGVLRQGDPQGVSRALELLQRTVLSFGIKVCGHREDAEDTAQEVLLKSLPHLVHLDDPQSLSAWLYTAAKNRCWQTRRRASYRRSVALEDLMPAGDELSALLADSGRSPEAIAASREDSRLLQQAVLELPPQYRIVLVLHDMEELETEQVARILSLQTGTVRVRLHRARLMLRREVNRLLRSEPRKSPAKKAAGARSADCRKIFANLSEYLDNRLQPGSCEKMRSHIESCPACLVFIQDLKRAIDRCRALEVCPDAEVSPVLRRLLTEEYLRLLGDSPKNPAKKSSPRL